jgi:hypothetical protein
MCHNDNVSKNYKNKTKNPMQMTTTQRNNDLGQQTSLYWKEVEGEIFPMTSSDFKHYKNSGSFIKVKPCIIHTNEYIRRCEEQLLATVFKYQSSDLEYQVLDEVKNRLSNLIMNGVNTLYAAEKDYIIKLIEDVILMTFSLIRSKTKSDVALAITTFVKLRCDGPLISSRRITMMSNYFSTIFSGFTPQSSDGLLVKLRNILNKYDEIKHSTIFVKLYRFLMFSLSLSLFDKAGVTFDTFNYTKIEQEALRKKYHGGADFIHCLLDTTLFLCERGCQAMVTGDIDCIFHSGGAYEDWFTVARKLQADAAFLTNPEPHNLDRFKYLSDLNDCIEKGESIYKHASRLGDIEKRFIGALLANLHLIKSNELTKRAAQQTRKAPFSVLLYGGSSVGKSQFTDLLFTYYGKIFDLQIDPEYKYTRNPVDQYWTNFNSTQWCVHLDDIAFMNPNKAQGGDPSVMEMLQVVNNVPFVPTQADLLDKGKTPMNARLVIATTNTENLNANSYFSCALAVRRRLPFIIELQPKKEYSKNDVMLDGSKLPPLVEGELPDYWNITVKRVVPLTHSRAQTEIIEKFSDIYTFLPWFARVAEEHENIQDKSTSCGKIMRLTNICKLCKIPSARCSCSKECIYQAQDDDSENSSSFYSEALYARCRAAVLNGEWLLPGDKYGDEAFNSNDGELGFGYTITTCFLFCWLTLFLMFPSRIFYTIFIWTMNAVYYFTGEHYLLVIFNRIIDPRMTRFLYRAIGDRVSKKIGKFRFLINIAAAIAGSAAMIYTFSTMWKLITSSAADEEAENVEKDIDNASTVFDDEEDVDLFPVYQGGQMSSTIGSTPTPLANERVNVWVKNDYKTTNFDITPVTSSMKALPLNKINNIIFNNCVQFRFQYVGEDGEQRIRSTRAVCVTGHYYLVNTHAVNFNQDILLTITNCSESDQINTNITILVTPKMFRHLPGRDLSMIQILAVPPKKDITQLFCKESLEGVFSAVYLGRTASGDKFARDVHRVQLVKDFATNSLETKTSTWFGKVLVATESGDCGSVLLSHTECGPIILGIHYIGNIPDRVVGAIRVTDTDLQQLISLFKDEFVVQDGEPLLSAPSVQRTLTDLHWKSPIRYIPTGTASVYGSFTGFRAAGKSMVRDTLIKPSMLRRGYKDDFAAPVMTGWVPPRLALLEMVRPATLLNPDILEQATDSFIKDILEGLTPEEISMVQVYDDITAINGAPGVAYVDKINRSTSAGNPWKKSKKFFLKPIPPVNGVSDPVEVDSEIMDRVDLCIKTYHEGKRYMPNFCAHLKDEPLPKKKVKLGKTRVFTGAPFCWSLVVRKYLLSVVRLLQNKKFVFEAAPGTVAQSREWEQIRSYLVHFGDNNIVAGDYGKFDKRMPAIMIQSAFQIIYALCEKAGYTKDDLRVVKGIATDTSYPLVDYFGDLIMFYGSNPSGHPLTVIINSLANSLYMRYCYIILNPSKECSSFKKNVHLMTYGDDNCMGINPDIPWFNHTTIQKTLADVDIEYTMADKEAESVPYLHINQISFLKRTWRWDPDVKAYLCPLDHSSIDKMVTKCVASKTICREQHAIAVIATAIREYFFYGREIFEIKRQMFQGVIEENDLQLYVENSTLPTWETLKQSFDDASKDIDGRTW